MLHFCYAFHGNSERGIVSTTTGLGSSANSMDVPKQLMREPPLPGIAISLDFELRWGVHDRYGLDFHAYRENIENVPVVIPEILQLLVARDIKATWAAVGALACKNWDEYFRRAPEPPRYTNPAFAVKPQYADLDPNGVLHFAPDLLYTILETPGQELGTHTFSHLYLREQGVTAADVAADLAAVTELYQERFGFVPRSLVFPRNEHAFLEVIRASPIKIWRGNEAAWYYECQGDASNWILPRALRLVDSLIPLRTRAASIEDDMTRASLFLRFNLPRYLWLAQFERIKRELDRLQPNEVFHIWFHPHNLGADTALRLSRLEQILDVIAEAQYRRRLLSCSMGDLATCVAVSRATATLAKPRRSPSEPYPSAVPA